MNLLSQATHLNPVRSLIQNYFAIWFCGDNSFPALSSPDVKLNLLSQATHMNLVCSLIQDYFAIWFCGDNSFPAICKCSDFVLSLCSVKRCRHIVKKKGQNFLRLHSLCEGSYVNKVVLRGFTVLELDGEWEETVCVGFPFPIASAAFTAIFFHFLK